VVAVVAVVAVNACKLEVMSSNPIGSKIFIVISVTNALIDLPKTYLLTNYLARKHNF